MSEQTKQVGHTYGAWRFGKPFKAEIEKRGCCDLIGIGNGASHIAYVSITGDVPLVEAQANARLIAAAPDLLTACEALLRVHYDEGKASLKGLQATNLADAAIAKAKGQP